MDLPENGRFPLEDVVALHQVDRGSKAVSLAVEAVHQQLCVVADLLREVIGEVRAGQ